MGLRQAGKLSPDAEATFHRASCTLGNQVVGASDGAPFRQERRPTRVCRTPGAGSGLLAEASTLRAGTAIIPPCRTLERRTGLGAAVVLPVAGTYRLIEPSTTRGERVVRCPRAERGPAVTPIGDPSTPCVIGPYWRGVDVSSAVSRLHPPRSNGRSCPGGSGGHDDHPLRTGRSVRPWCALGWAQQFGSSSNSNEASSFVSDVCKPVSVDRGSRC